MKKLLSIVAIASGAVLALTLGLKRINGGKNA
jgi:hypothetical protein